MFWKKKSPKMEKVQKVTTYFMRYDGETGYIQVADKVTKKFVAVQVNNPAGKVWRIMKVTKREFYSDFGCTCTGLDIKATEFILEQP